MTARASDIDGKRFVTTGNPHGVSGAETIFEYHVDGERIRGSYRGGRIAEGQLIGRVTGAGSIALLYHCITTTGDLLAGESTGTVGRDATGRVTLDFEWAWLTGDRSGGQSSYVELDERDKADERRA